MIERALISVHDKTGLDAFGTGLSELGVELVASGGTRAVLTEQNSRGHRGVGAHGDSRAHGWAREDAASADPRRNPCAP